MKKRLNKMTSEEISAEVQGWEKGDFADGTWEHAHEAIPASERHFPLVGELSLELGDFFFYITGEDSVRRNIVSFAELFDTISYSRGRGGKRNVQFPTPWAELNTLQKNSLCRLLWATKSGEFAIVDAVTGELVTTHSVPAEADSGSTPEGND